MVRDLFPVKEYFFTNVGCGLSPMLVPTVGGYN
jgi:hypothetical protein